MRKALLPLAAVVLVALAPGRAYAWGFAAHRLIMRRAIEILPAELKPLFDKYKDEVLVRVTDPDTWRTAGWEDDPNHFLDLGVPEYGPYPFSALPREYDKALAKFGRATLVRYGLLPWREGEMAGNLRRTFEEFKRSAPYTVSNLVLLSSVASHYMQDAHQPFHATDNFDGALTGNNGIHARFERDLIERFESRLTLKPAAPAPMADPQAASFDALLASFLLVDPILAADKDASAGKDTYDAAYFEAFFAKVQPILERQLSAAITATASLIIGAWDQAGRPVLRLSDDRTPQRVARPR